MFFRSLKRDISLDSSSTTTASTLCCEMADEDDGSCANDSCANDISKKVSVSFRIERGDLPLHRALAEFSLQSIADPNNVTWLEEQIKHLIQSSPDSVDLFTSDGMSPLHIACREGASLAVIRSLVKARPASVKIATRNGRQMLPLHLVCRYYSGPTATMYQIVQFLLGVYPEAAKITTGTGELALHLYCRNHFCTVRVLELLVRAYPDARNIGTQTRRQLPIHLACERRYFERSEGRKNPTKENGGETAINTSSGSDEVIRYLLWTNPESVTVYDANGELPLHAAVRGYQTTATLTFLLKAFPDSIQFLEDTGRTALHIAVSNAVPDLATVQLLLQADVSATTVVDDCNMTPMHYAAKGNNLHILYMLIRGCPNSIEALKTKATSLSTRHVD